MSLFKSYSIDLDYVFHSQAEKYLFSRLIYKYIKQLLNVLFADYALENIDIRNKMVAEKYNKVIAKIREEVNTVDIYELIYRNSTWLDAEFITYKELDLKACDSIMLIENFFDIKKFDYIEDIDRCVHIRPSDRRTTYTYKAISYLSYELNMRKRLSIRYSPLDRYVSVELFELSDESNKTLKLDKEKYVPRFVCIAFPKKDIEDELKAESKKDLDNPIIINSLEDLEKEVYDKLESNVQDYILKNYTAERKRYLTLTEQAVIIIEKILQVDYNSCFSDDKHIPAGFQQGFSRFRRFLKNQKIAIDKDTIVYKYLYSLWIDAFCYKLELMIYTMNKECNNVEFYNKLLKRIKEMSFFKELETNKKCGTIDSLDNADKLYCSFYRKYEDVIEAFNQKVDVLKNGAFENEFEFRLEKGRGPYAYLKTSLCEFKKYLEDAAANCMSSEQAHMSLG